MHIIRLEAQNIQRLQAVTIEPNADSPAVVLAGGNEEGKSSCLDAIEMALAGERTIPPEPIRRGQEKASVVVDLGDMIVTRRFTKAGSSITVTNREGLKYPSPQSLLDGLYNRLTFDPLAFAQAKPDEQAAILRRLASLDTTALDKERAMVFATRTEVNRDLAREKAVLEKAPQFGDVGTAYQDAKDVLAQLADADRLAKVLTEADRQLALAQATQQSASQRLTGAREAVDVARRALEAAERERDAAEDALAAATTNSQALQEARSAAQRAVPDVAALRDQLAGVQEHNRKVDGNQRRAQLADQVVTLQQTADGHTARLEAIDQEKAERLAAVTFPVDGLGLDDHGVTWNGLPFEQASTAIRTRVSVSIGFALHPKLKVLLVRNGNDLDAKNLKLLADAAAEVGGQLWIERIAGGDGLQTVVIEDGAVKGAPPATDGDRSTREAAPAAKAQSPEPKGRPPKSAPRSAPGLFADGKPK